MPTRNSPSGYTTRTECSKDAGVTRYDVKLYPGPSKTSKMESFATIVNDL